MPSSGSFTVGSGGTYATWGAAMAAMTFPMTGDLTFTQISNISEAAIFRSAGSMGGFKLTFTSDTPHYGSPILGWKATVAGDWLITHLSNGTLEVDDLYVDSNGSSGGFAIASANSAITIKICRSLFRTRKAGGQAFDVGAHVGSLTEVSGSKFWLASGASGSAFVYTQPSTDATAIFKMENCMAYASGAVAGSAGFDFQWSGGAGNVNAATYIKNCFGFCDTGATQYTFNFYDNDMRLRQSNNAVSACLPSGTPAATFTYSGLGQAGNILTLNDTLPGFLNLDPASALFTAGVANLLACNPFFGGAGGPLGIRSFAPVAPPSIWPLGGG